MKQMKSSHGNSEGNSEYNFTAKFIQLKNQNEGHRKMQESINLTTKQFAEIAIQTEDPEERADSALKSPA